MKAFPFVLAAFLATPLATPSMAACVPGTFISSNAHPKNVCFREKNVTLHTRVLRQAKYGLAPPINDLTIDQEPGYPQLQAPQALRRENFSAKLPSEPWPSGFNTNGRG